MYVARTKIVATVDSANARAQKKFVFPVLVSSQQDSDWNFLRKKPSSI